MAPDRQPWYKKYPTDWRGDTNLRACSLAARGLWDECLGLMHEAEPRGCLVFAGEPVSVEQLALLVSRPLKEVKAALAELEHAGVPSRDEHGTIYSRRMVRDTAKSAQASAYGSRGGNPRLKREVNGQVKPLDNPAGAQTRVLSSEHLGSDLVVKEGEREREPARFGRHSTLMPPSPKNAAFAGKFIVPDFLDAEFDRKSGKPYEVRQAWYRQLDAEWRDRTIGEDDLKFLRARFLEWVGPTPSVPPALNTASLASALVKLK